MRLSAARKQSTHDHCFGVDVIVAPLVSNVSQQSTSHPLPSGKNLDKWHLPASSWDVQRWNVPMQSFLYRVVPFLFLKFKISTFELYVPAFAVLRCTVHLQQPRIFGFKPQFPCHETAVCDICRAHTCPPCSPIYYDVGKQPKLLGPK